MLGHLMNNSHTSFGRQGENKDDEFPSAPASLPSVPSFGTEEWRQFRFNALADASTTSASPISPCFPGFASSGSSAGIARSYSTTPLSSTSVEIPRNSLPLLLETSLQVQSAESNPKMHTKFILEDPTMAKHKKDKAMRACTPCFTRRWECSESETPNRCTHCVGKSSYCKGPIETPRLLDLEYFDATTAALLERHYQSIGLHHESGRFGPMQVDLRLEPLSEQEIVSDGQTHCLQLPGLREDFRFLWEPSSLDGVLDAILPTDVPLCIASKPGLYDLSLYELIGIAIPAKRATPQRVPKSGPTRESCQHTSFLDILRDYTLQEYPTGNQHVPTMYSNDTIESWQNVNAEDSTLLAGQQSQEDIGNGQDMIIKDDVSFGVKRLQAEANAMLNPGWILGLDDFAVTQNTETSVATDHFHAGILEPMTHGQDVDWDQQPSEIQQTGHAYLSDIVPTYTVIGGSMLTSPHDVIALSQAQSDTTQGLNTANSTALSDSAKQLCSLPVPASTEVLKRASKRKRIKTVFSRKKPRLIPSHLSHSEDSSASMTDSSSRLAIRTDSVAETTMSKGTTSSKQPRNDYPTEQPRAVAAWEQGRNRRTNLDNVGIVRDIKVLDSERRPMSWPHRNPWRKSLDISVAVLTRGFEKLMTERGESALSAV
ncbi:MAG: hypothetical protein ASARMPRED_005171 [Alectoria sarmentosa]|nr:MAG: hypothetical protein ASARMPRED_005171 [Alectoria sarmentosa]